MNRYKALFNILNFSPLIFVSIIFDNIRKRIHKKAIGISDIKLLESKSGMKFLMNKFKEENTDSISCFNDLILKLKENIYDRTNNNMVYTKVFDVLEKNEKLLFVRLLYEGERFNKDLLKRYISFIMENSNDNYIELFWLLQDVTEMVFRYPDYLYNEFYNDRKKIINKIRKNIKLSCEREENKTFDNNCLCEKYAIIVNGLADESNAVSYLVFQYANELIKKGKEVKIFPSDALYYNYGDCLIYPIKGTKSCSAAFYDSHRKYLNSSCDVVYTRGCTIYQKISNCLKNIIDFKPDIVIDASGQCSFFTAFIKGRYPIIHLSFNNYIVGAVFDKYISKYKIFTLEDNQRFHAIDDSKIEEILIGFQYKEPRKKFNRKDYNLAEEDFVYITVGNRLDVELQMDFIEVICRHLYSSEIARWIIVGKSELKKFLKYKDLLDKNKIIFVKYEDDLTGLYTICDAYLNPDRTGGGTSVFWAMCQAMPIVITDFRSDILPAIGIENTIHGGYDEMIIYMRKLEYDSRYCRKMGKLMEERSKLSNIEQYITSLINICNDEKKNFIKGKILE